MASPVPQRRFQNPAVFVCDIQEKFRGPIFEFDKVVQTTSKLLRFATLLKIPIYITTQNRARLGDTVSELKSVLAQSPSLIKADLDKTRFSMYIPPIASHFPHTSSESTKQSEVVIVGIESHICVTQTALDLVEAGHKVYVLADGVSSCNRMEVPIALERLRAAGVVVTSSESWMYECLGDAGGEEFKGVMGLVKETAGETRGVLEGLVGGWVLGGGVSSKI